MTPDIATERAIIGATLLLDGEEMPAATAAIEPEYFRDPDHAKIWMAITEARRSGVGDEIGTTSALKGLGFPGLAAVVCELAADCMTVTNLGHWSAMLVRHGRARELRRRVEHAAAVGATDDPDDLQAGIVEAMRSVAGAVDESGLVRVGTLLPGVVRDLELATRDPDFGVMAKTGVGAYDDMVKMRRGELSVIAGRPSSGKTAFAGMAAVFAARDITKGAVAIFSLEMSASSLVSRMLSQSARDDARKLARAGSHRLLEASQNLSKVDVYIDDRPQIGLDEMRRALGRLSAVSLVMVDYLQIAKLPGGNDMRHDQKLGEYTAGLKAIAKDFGCHVIALAQMNREASKRSSPEPRVEDIRGSGEIEQAADIITMIHRPSQHDDTADPTDATLYVRKQRNGPTGAVDAIWKPEAQIFYDAGR